VIIIARRLKTTETRVPNPAQHPFLQAPLERDQRSHLRLPMLMSLA